jgi:hypothetical protein
LSEVVSNRLIRPRISTFDAVGVRYFYLEYDFRRKPTFARRLA